jgi:hypothetical protein
MAMAMAMASAMAREKRVMAKRHDSSSYASSSCSWAGA